MSTEALRIRDAIAERLQPLVVPGGIKMVRTVPVMMLQPDDLPAVTISLLNERMTPLGDDNASGMSFESEVTIAISVVRGGVPPVTLDQQADSDAGIIENMLLTDASFTRFGPDKSFPVGDIRREPLFEAVTGISRRRIFPQTGEKYFVETRVEMSFRTSVDFAVNVDDFLSGMRLTAKPAGAGDHTPALEVEIDFPEPED